MSKTNGTNGTAAYTNEEAKVLAQAAAAGNSVIQLDEPDAQMAKEAQGRVQELHLILGEERERYRITEITLLNQLAEARKSFEGLVVNLTKRYVQDKNPQQLTFLPEVGAFIGPPAQEDDKERDQ